MSQHVLPAVLANTGEWPVIIMGVPDLTATDCESDPTISLQVQRSDINVDMSGSLGYRASAWKQSGETLVGVGSTESFAAAGGIALTRELIDPWQPRCQYYIDNEAWANFPEAYFWHENNTYEGNDGWTDGNHDVYWWCSHRYLDIDVWPDDTVDDNTIEMAITYSTETVSDNHLTGTDRSVSVDLSTPQTATYEAEYYAGHVYIDLFRVDRPRLQHVREISITFPEGAEWTVHGMSLVQDNGNGIEDASNAALAGRFVAPSGFTRNDGGHMISASPIESGGRGVTTNGHGYWSHGDDVVAEYDADDDPVYWQYRVNVGPGSAVIDRLYPRQWEYGYLICPLFSEPHHWTDPAGRLWLAAIRQGDGVRVWHRPSPQQSWVEHVQNITPSPRDAVTPHTYVTFHEPRQTYAAGGVRAVEDGKCQEVLCTSGNYDTWGGQEYLVEHINWLFGSGTGTDLSGAWSLTQYLSIMGYCCEGWEWNLPDDWSDRTVDDNDETLTGGYSFDLAERQDWGKLNGEIDGDGTDPGTYPIRVAAWCWGSVRGILYKPYGVLQAQGGLHGLSNVRNGHGGIIQRRDSDESGWQTVVGPENNDIELGTLAWAESTDDGWTWQTL